MPNTTDELTIELCCPTCADELVRASDSALCRTCSIAYPELAATTSPLTAEGVDQRPAVAQRPAKVHCCYANPKQELAGWRASAHSALQELLEAKRQVEMASLTRSSQLTRTRLNTLAEGYTGQIDCLTQLLAPLLADQPTSDKTTYDALATRPLTQPTTLLGYSTNIFRDWAWGESENQQAVELISEVASAPLGNLLVLGAGAGRLAYDLSHRTDGQVIAVDLNPYTSLLGAMLSSGAAIDLWEFPFAPKETTDVAVKHRLQVPEARANLHWVLADARTLPFSAQRFDTVLTPWYTDVAQEPPTATAKRVNNLLVNGGQWLNFGSASFADAKLADQLSLHELLELVSQQGFDTPSCVEAPGAYLHSPHSRFSRVEELHAFAAIKHTHKGKPQPPALPTWLTDYNEPIPALEGFVQQAMSTQIHAYLMSLIDDQRSIADIAQILQQRQLMDAAEAQPVVQNFLRKLYLANPPN